MDRAEFLERLRSSRIAVTAKEIPGFGTVYMRPATMADTKAAMLSKRKKDGTLAERMEADPFFLERGLAGIVRDESGALLFDPEDDAQMAELSAVLGDASSSISRAINEAYNGLEQPNSEEVDASGNSPSANS